MNDPVNHPEHYTKGRQYEIIAFLEDWGLDPLSWQCPKIYLTGRTERRF
jgi:hypothetical protein